MWLLDWNWRLYFYLITCIMGSSLHLGHTDLCSTNLFIYNYYVLVYILPHELELFAPCNPVGILLFCPHQDQVQHLCDGDGDGSDVDLVRAQAKATDCIICCWFAVHGIRYVEI